MRYLAIYFMLMANTASFLEQMHYDFIFRLLSSLAAPLFLYIFGSNIFRTSLIGSKKLLKRIIEFVVAAVVLDTIYGGIYPFQNGDILYTFLFLFLFFYIMKKLKDYIQISILFFMMASCLAVYFFIDYDANILYLVWGGHYPGWRDIFVISIRNTFYQGWFPIFPWAFFAILGYLIQKYSLYNKLSWKKLLSCSLLVFITGYIFFIFKSSAPLRKNYVELFYPCDLVSILFLSSAVVFLHMLILFIPTIRIQKIYFIRHSIYIYVLHYFLLRCIFEQHQVQFSSVWTIFIFALLALFALLGCDLALNRITESFKLAKMRS